MKVTNVVTDELISALTNNKLSDSVRDILGQSLFYYCSGNDPSPIIAFGSSIPLYVYVDSFLYMRETYTEATEELYSRLKNSKFKMLDSVRFSTLPQKLRKAENASLTTWRDESGEAFLLLYVKADATDAYDGIYGDEKYNFIQPKYVCNHRYEIHDRDRMNQIEKRAQYILGHCFDPKFRRIGEFPYWYSKTEKIGIYHRFYYYLF